MLTSGHWIYPADGRCRRRQGGGSLICPLDISREAGGVGGGGGLRADYRVTADHLWRRPASVAAQPLDPACSESDQPPCSDRLVH